MNTLLDSVVRTYRVLCDKAPSLFAQATADALDEAYRAAIEPRGRQFFETVSSGTGSGKTKAAEALIAFITPSTPVTLVIKEIREIDDVYLDLVKLLPASVRVAMWDSVHRRGAAEHVVREKAVELGRPIAAQFSLEEAATSDVLLTTHDQWKSAVDGNPDRGFVLRRRGRDCLVIVDEDPDLERTYIRRPEHLAELIGLLSAAVMSNEARAYGLAKTHRAVPVLRRIQERMENIRSTTALAALTCGAIIEDEDVKMIDTITDEEIRKRAALGRIGFEALERVRGTMDFLKAACEGRVFFSKDRMPSFHAYTTAIPPQPRTILLDGTADLNGVFSVSGHVHITKQTVTPDYEAAELYGVIPPRQFRGRIRPGRGGLLRDRWTAEPLMAWFMRDVLLANTKPGEHILVYAKRDLIALGIHCDYDQSGRRDPFCIEFEGRTVYFCNFGAGRGSNRWKHCTVCFRLSEFYPQKAVTIAKVYSMTGQKASEDDLSSLSTGTTTHELYLMAQATHIAVHNKQETARICIREFDNVGRCAPARVYFVDTDLEMLLKYQQRMYPGSEPIKVMDLSGETQKPKKASQRAMDVLLSAPVGSRFTYGELAEHVESTVAAVKKAIGRRWRSLEAIGYVREDEANSEGQASAVLVRQGQ